MTLYDNSDNSLLGTLGNGVNNYLLDTPQHLPGSLQVNTNGRNGKAAFNTALFPEESLGTLGDARRRTFYGPGIENFDMTLEKRLSLGESRSLTFRAEAFNIFNHPDFDAPNNDVSFFPNYSGPPSFPPSGSLGYIQHTIGSPRFLQLSLHLAF